MTYPKLPTGWWLWSTRAREMRRTISAGSYQADRLLWTRPRWFRPARGRRLRSVARRCTRGEWLHDRSPGHRADGRDACPLGRHDAHEHDDRGHDRGRRHDLAQDHDGETER